MNSQIRLQTNEENLYKNLGHVFSDKAKVLSELLQNARRAGATAIHIMHENNTLSIVDNGHGIADFQKLLTNAESGWDDKVMADEDPFGMGWLSTLYAADQIEVVSLGKRCLIDTKSVRKMAPFNVEQVLNNGTTSISLVGFPMSLTETLDKLVAIVKGFPVRIWFNGTELDRPHATDKLVMTDLACGRGHIQGIHTEESDTDYCYYYYQGLLVKNPSVSTWYTSPHRNIIHLDDTFQVRMPDRDNLLDAENAAKRISQSVDAAWKAHLVELKSSLPAKVFVTHYRKLAKLDLLELLNDIDILPPEVMSCIENYPVKQSNGYQCEAPLTTRADIEKKECVILSNLHSVEDQFEYAVAFVIYRENWLVLDKELHAGHWVYNHTLDLTRAAIRVDREPVQKQAFCLGTACGEIELVTQFTVQIGPHALTYTDEAISLNTSECGDEGTLIIAGDPGQVVEQLCDFISDDRWQEDWRDEDTIELNDLVAIMRGEPATESIKKALRAVRLHEKLNCHDIAVVTAVRHNIVKCLTLEEVLATFCEQTGAVVTAEDIATFIHHLKPVIQPVALKQTAMAIDRQITPITA